MAADSDRIDARVWRVSGVVLVGSVMSILDTTIVNVALATLGRELHSGSCRGSSRRPDRLDVRGLALMATGLPLLTYGLAEIGVTGGLTATKVVGPCLAGLS
jgi:hypothetical protein